MPRFSGQFRAQGIVAGYRLVRLKPGQAEIILTSFSPETKYQRALAYRVAQRRMDCRGQWEDTRHFQAILRRLYSADIRWLPYGPLDAMS